MMCPRCQDDELGVIRTMRFEKYIKRVRICKHCTFVFTTNETIKAVAVFNNASRKADMVKPEKYEQLELWNEAR